MERAQNVFAAPDDNFKLAQESEYYTDVVSWQGHVPFARDLIRVFKPNVFVELGTHKGDSFTAFCRAVVANNLGTQCYAVDTWEGDKHAGYYGDKVFADLKSHVSDAYPGIAHLIRSTFDDALQHIDDRSVDLLHIDGLHTYEAVSHDFDSWKRKLSSRAIVLFHDTVVFESDFGVWKLWAELKTQYPSFEFSHSNGLGVLAVGAQATEQIDGLFDASPDLASRIQQKYSVLGRAVAFHGYDRLVREERVTASREIERLSAHITELEQDNQRLTQDINQVRDAARIATSHLTDSLATKNQKNAALQHELAVLLRNREVYKDAYQTLLASRSWALTRPMRVAARAARRVLRGRSAVTVSESSATEDESGPADVSPECVASAGRTRAEVEQVLAELDRNTGNGKPSFRHVDSPVVTVIIPVYGQLDYTIRCLNGLFVHETDFPFDVIVVDDCSPDDSVTILRDVPGITLIENDTNLGFIRTCNKAARKARGNYIALLNNDTVVMPGWIDAMVRTFETIPGVGLVGSKLLFPDGTLQEAGGILWEDGSAWNYGRTEDADAPRFEYMRDVDYCSGASLLISRKLWEQLDGFDQAYVPAYCEDSDLAMRVREAGFRVVYQPQSRVIHFEGVTSGTDVTSGTKRYQVDNSKKLFDQWREVFADYGSPGVNPDLVKDRTAKARVLVLDHCTPEPDKDAGSITAINIMRIFQALGFQVTFIPRDNWAYDSRYTVEMQELGIECLYHPYETAVEGHLQECGAKYDVVCLFRFETALRHLDAIALFCPDSRTILHASDLHYLREQREAQLRSDSSLMDRANATKQKELAAVSRVDLTIVHSSVEQEILNEELGWESEERVAVFPWAIDIPGRTLGFSARNGIVFVGGYQHPPNVDAVEFFASEVFPLIRREIPEARFLIVGSKAPESLNNLVGNGVELIGFVSDLDALMESCRVAVAPLRYGAGIKGKIGTYLSYAVPCVSTSIGAEGMRLTDGKNVLVADSPEDFAAAVVRSYSDEEVWNRLSDGGLAFVHDNYSLEAGKGTVSDILTTVGIQHDWSNRPVINPKPGHSVSAFRRTPPVASLDPAASATSRREYEAYLESDVADHQRGVQRELVRAFRSRDPFRVAGYCELCKRDMGFRVGKLYSGDVDRDDWEPNWREHLICPSCQMNCRQRVSVGTATRVAKSLESSSRVSVYMTEQVCHGFKWMHRHNPGIDLVGSEYLGPSLSGGTEIDGVRHEDVESLSFGDQAFDIIVSNDVLEHVNRPAVALAEFQRVLKPNGCLILSVPFHTLLDKNRRRAELVDGSVVNYHPEVFHGNPVAAEQGSLVFVDFGWEFFDDIRAAGFSDVRMQFYWDSDFGYFGVGDHFILASKA